MSLPFPHRAFAGGCGFGLWVDHDGKLNHTYSFLGVETYKQTSAEKIPTGKVTVKMVFETGKALHEHAQMHGIGQGAAG